MKDIKDNLELNSNKLKKISEKQEYKNAYNLLAKYLKWREERERKKRLFIP